MRRTWIFNSSILFAIFLISQFFIGCESSEEADLRSDRKARQYNGTWIYWIDGQALLELKLNVSLLESGGPLEGDGMLRSLTGQSPLEFEFHAAESGYGRLWLFFDNTAQATVRILQEPTYLSFMLDKGDLPGITKGPIIFTKLLSG